jgi:hypothetical protein
MISFETTFFVLLVILPAVLVVIPCLLLWFVFVRYVAPPLNRPWLLWLATLLVAVLIWYLFDPLLLIDPLVSEILEGGYVSLYFTVFLFSPLLTLLFGSILIVYSKKLAINGDATQSEETPAWRVMLAKLLQTYPVKLLLALLLAPLSVGVVAVMAGLIYDLPKMEQAVELLFFFPVAFTRWMYFSLIAYKCMFVLGVPFYLLMFVFRVRAWWFFVLYGSLSAPIYYILSNIDEFYLIKTRLDVFGYMLSGAVIAAVFCYLLYGKKEKPA